jgi:hypothetical protein
MRLLLVLSSVVCSLLQAASIYQSIQALPANFEAHFAEFCKTGEIPPPMSSHLQVFLRNSFDRFIHQQADGLVMSSITKYDRSGYLLEDLDVDELLAIAVTQGRGLMVLIWLLNHPKWTIDLHLSIIEACIRRRDSYMLHYCMVERPTAGLPDVILAVGITANRFSFTLKSLMSYGNLLYLPYVIKDAFEFNSEALIELAKLANQPETAETIARYHGSSNGAAHSREDHEAVLIVEQLAKVEYGPGYEGSYTSFHDSVIKHIKNPKAKL